MIFHWALNITSQLESSPMSTAYLAPNVVYSIKSLTNDVKYDSLTLDEVNIMIYQPKRL